MQFGISVLFISIYLMCKQNKIAMILKYRVEVLFETLSYKNIKLILTCMYTNKY